MKCNIYYYNYIIKFDNINRFVLMINFSKNYENIINLMVSTRILTQLNCDYLTSFRIILLGKIITIKLYTFATSILPK